jgi:hypothetical protein
MEPTFEVIVSTYATQAAVSLGQIPNPITKKTEVDLPQAKFAIDLLQVLEEKTKGNRTAEEDKFLSDCLYQLRMVYISR